MAKSKSVNNHAGNLSSELVPFDEKMMRTMHKQLVTTGIPEINGMTIVRVNGLVPTDDKPKRTSSRKPKSSPSRAYGDKDASTY